MWRLCAAMFILQFPASTAFAQVETARIEGTVTDTSSAVIPGATITITHVSTNSGFTTKSDAAGHYLSVPLRIGEYRVEATAQGFKHTVRSGIILQIQETAVINLQLEVGAVTESVDVTADAPLLATAEASQGQVIDNRKIVDMPLNGRDYIELALLSAGTVQPTNGSRYGGFSAAGQRTTQNNYLLDGIDNNNVQLAANSRRAEAVKPSVDAIQEFKISTNAYSAEYGRATGGVVNATIKSGSNEIHGSVFEFVRNDKLDAKNFFDAPDEPRVPFKRNQFGFSAGAPIVRNKTFIFGDYEWTRIRESRTVNATIPTMQMRGGDFGNTGATIYDPNTYSAASKTRQPFPNNTIPADRFDRVAKQALAWYPAPQNEKLTQNFLYNPRQNEDVGKWDIRADQILGAKDTVYFRFSYQHNFAPPAPSLPAPAFGASGENGVDTINDGRNMALVWSHIFSPSIVTTTRLGWNRLYGQLLPTVNYNANAQLGLTGVDQSIPGTPQFAISDFTGLGIGPNFPNYIDSQTRQFISDTTWTRRNHSVKFGVNLSWLQSFITNPKQALGQFTFNGNFSRNPLNNSGGRSLADFILGIPATTTVANPVYANLRAPFYDAYIQDEWRVSSRLTVNAGLRYELNLPWVETRNGQSNYDMDTNVANPQLVVARDGSRRDRALVGTYYRNFAPRLGIAWQLSSKTVVRSAFGIFIGNYEGTGGGRHMLGNPPNTISVQISTDSITPAFVLRDGVPPMLMPQNVKNLRLTSFENDPKWPTSQQWNLNIQHQLAQNLVWEVGYYAAHSVHQPMRWNSNYALPGPGNINARRRFKSVLYPGTNILISPLAIVDRHDYFGSNSFNSLQTRIEKRFSRGVTFLASYTYSKNIGDTSGFSGSGTAPGDDGLQNPLNRRLERAVDDQDVTHRLVASYQYELPFGAKRAWGSSWKGVTDAVLGGWSVGGITAMSSGLPLSLTVRGDPANTGDVDRPNVVGDWRLSSGERTLDRFFNTAAFVPNAPYTYGNAGRNILRQPGMVNFDFAAFKRFPVTERFNVQFRFEAFNFFNTPRFGAPNAEVGNVNFGRITSAATPRNLQFGLKLIW